MLLNNNRLDYAMKLPRAKPKIMGVPVSIETAKDLAKASRDIFMRRFVPDEVKSERMEICRTCPSWNESSNRCRECGCQMRVKTTLTSSKCPLNKWDRYVPSYAGDSTIDSA
tara:strand:- start:132 stop:467 length:336 start_codon:yes stop_codon:yes gene_type:complete